MIFNILYWLLYSSKKYTWERYSVNTITTYYWNKYNATSSTEYGISYSYTSGSYNGSVNYSVQSSTIKQSNGRFTNLTSATYEGINVGHWFMQRATGPAYYCSREYDWETDTPLGYSRIATITQTTVYSQGSTSYGQVSSTNSSAYPSNGYSNGYYYVKSSATTTQKEQGSLIDTVENKNISAYPTNGIHTDGYWYVLKDSNT